jgi:hypothetical protein
VVKEYTLVFINSELELVESGRDLQSLEKNSLLALNSDIFWPLDKSCEISLGLDVSSDSEVSRIFLKQRTIYSLATSFSSS